MLMLLSPDQTIMSVTVIATLERLAIKNEQRRSLIYGERLMSDRLPCVSHS
jgi:hypothetical protein